MNEFVGKSHHELSLHPRFHFKSPQFGVFVAWEGHITAYKLLDHVFIVNLLFLLDLT